MDIGCGDNLNVHNDPFDHGDDYDHSHYDYPVAIWILSPALGQIRIQTILCCQDILSVMTEDEPLTSTMIMTYNDDDYHAHPLLSSPLRCSQLFIISSPIPFLFFLFFLFL